MSPPATAEASTRFYVADLIDHPSGGVIHVRRVDFDPLARLEAEQPLPFHWSLAAALVDGPEFLEQGVMRVHQRCRSASPLVAGARVYVHAHHPDVVDEALDRLAVAGLEFGHRALVDASVAATPGAWLVVGAMPALVVNAG